MGRGLADRLAVERVWENLNCQLSQPVPLHRGHCTCRPHSAQAWHGMGISGLGIIQEIFP